MAWTAPRTWTTGELVTAAMLNTHVRDNLLAITGAFPNTLNPSGDNTFDLGTQGGTRWRHLALSGGITLNNPASGTAGSGEIKAAGAAWIEGALTVGTSSASAGAIRLPNNQVVNARNAANSADIGLITLDTANNVRIGDSSTVGVGFGGPLLWPLSNGTADIGGVGNNWRNIEMTGGIKCGTPTGAQLGAGKINVSAGVFLNNAAYTNPDYALEHWATGRIERFTDRAGAAAYPGLLSLSEVEAFAREHLHLPAVARLHDAPADIFARSDAVLEMLENVYCYLFEVNRQIKALGAAGV